MLYILQFSTYFFSFITVPYQTRVLGPVFYGKLGFATALMVYFQLFIDFGFLLSATEEVSRFREDKSKLSHILTCVTIGKLLLSLSAVVILLLACFFIPGWWENIGFYMLFLLSVIINSLLPDYLYRGLEQMSVITVRTVIIKFFFTVMIFVLLKKQTDYYVIPILNIIGNAGALIGIGVHLFKILNINLCKVSVEDVLKSLKKSSGFFYSRIATTLYTASNTLILGLISPGSGTIGFYTSADKLVTTAKNGLSPISDSLYPYMVKNRDFKLIRKTLTIIMPFIIVGCTVLFIFAESFCRIFFGEEFVSAAPVLRSLLPVVVVILPSYILGFPTLSAMGLSKYANLSVLFGSVLHLFNLFFLYITGHMNMITLGILTSITETIILLFRVLIIFRNRAIIKHDK